MLSWRKIVVLIVLLGLFVGLQVGDVLARSHRVHQIPNVHGDGEDPDADEPEAKGIVDEIHIEDDWFFVETPDDGFVVNVTEETKFLIRRGSAPTSSASFSITSEAFSPNGKIPKKYTCEGEDISLPLSWSGVPEGTKSLALIVDDPDAPDPKDPQMTWVHWVLYNIPPDVEGLAEGGNPPLGSIEGLNDWNRTGYGGPCPPIGRHRYFFKLYALDTVLSDLEARPTKSELEEAMQGKILGKAELTGTYMDSKQEDEPALKKFDNVVLLNPKAAGLYSNYKLPRNQIDLGYTDNGSTSDLLIYPVEKLEDGNVHGLLDGNISIINFDPFNDVILLLEMKQAKMLTVAEMIANGLNGPDGIVWTPSGAKDNVIYLADSPDGRNRFIYFDMAPGASRALAGTRVSDWPDFISTNPSLLEEAPAVTESKFESWVFGNDSQSNFGLMPLVSNAPYTFKGLMDATARGAADEPAGFDALRVGDEVIVFGTIGKGEFGEVTADRVVINREAVKEPGPDGPSSVLPWDESEGKSDTDDLPEGELDFTEVRIKGFDISGLDGGLPLYMTVDAPVFGLVQIDVTDAIIWDSEDRQISLDDLSPGTVVDVYGEVDADGDAYAYEILVIRFEGPQPVRGQVISINPPSDGKPGRLVMAGPVFAFDEFGTFVQGPQGGRISVRDLRPGLTVNIVFEETGKEGRGAPNAVHIRVIGPGKPPPPPGPGQFVGQIGKVDFEGSRLKIAVAFAFNNNTEVVDKEGNETDRSNVKPEALVLVIPFSTQFGIPGAAKVKILRGPGELPPERIESAMFIIDSEPVPIKRANSVPVSVRMRIRFDRPITKNTLDAIDELFIYGTGDEGEDVRFTPQVVDGDLVADLTLMEETVYDAFILLENGVEFYTQFTTGSFLPTLSVVSVDPANEASGVDTETTVSVTFNRKIYSDGEMVAADIFIQPHPLSGEIYPEDLTISEDRKTVSVDVELAEDQLYLVVVYDAGSEDGLTMETLYKSRFATGEIGTSTVTYRFENPPGVFLSPNPREWQGFVSLLPSDIDFENLEGDDNEELSVAFDITDGTDTALRNVPAGSYIVESFVFIEEGPNGRELGVVGTYADPDGDPLILEVAEGETQDITITMINELRVTSSMPAPGQGGVAAGRTRVTVQFSEPLRQNRGRLALEAEIQPPITGFDAARDLLPKQGAPRTIQATLNLRPDTDYQLVIFYAQGVSGAELFDVVDIPFSTRDQFVAGSISGTITMSDGSEPKGAVILGNLDEGIRVSEVKVRSNGTYEFKNVPEGTFGVFAKLVLEDERTVNGLLDADGNGEPDPIELAGGALSTDNDFTVTVPDAPVDGEPGANEGAVLAFDFGSSEGDDGVTVGQINAGDEFSVALYASAVTGLVGYDIVVAYDTTKIAAQTLSENSTEEGQNILRHSGGLGAFIGRITDEGVNVSAAILGPTEQVAVTGNGLLGVVNFVALETFSGETDLTITKATMQGLEAADDITSDASGKVRVVELTTMLALSASPTIITADGSDAATITAQVLDLDGVLQDGDSSTEVTFSISSGTGELSASSATASSGVATTTVTTSSTGTITIEAISEGAKTVAVSVVAEAASGEVAEGPRGPLALDMNLDSGDQEQSASGSVPAAGDNVVIDVVALEGAIDKVGINFNLNFDADALEFSSFAATDVFTGGLGITVPTTGAVEVSVALLGTFASKDAGSVGQATFKVLDGFSTSTTVVLASGEFGTASGATVLIGIGFGGASVLIGEAKTTDGGDGDGFTLTPAAGSGEWTLDLDETVGDQSVRELNGVAAGTEFTIELINNQSISPALGGSFTLSYDATKVEPVTSAITGIASQLGAPKIEDGTVTFTLAGLSGAVVDQGHVGQIGFKTLDGFEGETEITLTKAEIGNATTFENVASTPNNSVVIRSIGDDATAGPTPDFDGDGSVGFRDFIQFAQKFGSKEGDGTYDATFDLDSNAEVGFRDFILFAQFYGKDPSTFVPPSSKVLSKPTGELKTNQATGLALVPQSSKNADEAIVVVRLSDAADVTGYSLRVSYDGATMEWLGAETLQASRFAEDDGVSLEHLDGSDVVVLADLLESGLAVEGDGDLVRLKFRMLDETVPGRIEVVQALVSDGSGNVDVILGAHAADLRALPGDYVLNQNYPNPFNPETVVPFALPEAGELRLSIYNILGQEVKVLAGGPYEAGFYKVNWDGKDTSGHSLASGIYMVQMVTKGFTDVRKMLLMK